MVCEKCDKKMPTATALKYHTCSDKFQCPDCNKLFMQKTTLVEHRAVAHRPHQPTQLSSNLTDEKTEPEPKKSKISAQPEDKSANVAESKSTGVIKKLVDDWDEDDDEQSEEGVKGEKEKRETGGDSGAVPEAESVPTEPNPAQSADKAEELDEDQIVADVDDILNDSDNIMSDVENILGSKQSTSTKASKLNGKPSEKPVEPDAEAESAIIKTLADKKLPTVQCEECYECFEDQEKLTWHALNDHE